MGKKKPFFSKSQKVAASKVAGQRLRNALANFFSAMRDDKLFPSDEAFELLSAVSQRLFKYWLTMVVIGLIPVILLGIQTFALYRQTQLIRNQQLQMHRQNSLIAISAFQQFRALLYSAPQDSNGVSVDVESGSRLYRWKKPNQSQLSSLNYYLELDPATATQALYALRKDNSATVVAGVVDILRAGGIKSTFVEANLQYLDYVSWGLSHGVMPATKFNFSVLDGSDFSCADFRSSYFFETHAKGASFTGVNLSNSYMKKADFSGASFGPVINVSTVPDCGRQTNLSYSDMREVNLEGALFGSEAIPGKGPNLTCVDLRGSNWQRVRGWRRIDSVSNANIAGILNPPDGFIEWAQDNGAIADSSDFWRTNLGICGR